MRIQRHRGVRSRITSAQEGGGGNLYKRTLHFDGIAYTQKA